MSDYNMDDQEIVNHASAESIPAINQAPAESIPAVNQAPAESIPTDNQASAESIPAVNENAASEYKENTQKKINESVCSNIYQTITHSCFAVKTKGFSHIKNNTNCQDAFLCRKIEVNNKELLLAAVADGHGSKRYYLSEYGSSIAVECICATLKILCEKYNNIRDLYIAVRSEFPSMLYTLWCERVEEDYANRYPENEEEEKTDIHKKYGTTGMFCLVVENAFIYGKLDGNIVIYKNDEYVETILDDDDLIGSEAYSLCKKEDALKKWGFGIVYDAKFLIVSTDGLRNAFGDDDNTDLFYNSIDEIYNFIAKQGESIAIESLPEFLSRCSNEGSGDDITVCCITRK